MTLLRSTTKSLPFLRVTLTLRLSAKLPNPGANHRFTHGVSRHRDLLRPLAFDRAVDVDLTARFSSPGRREDDSRRMIVIPFSSAALML
jgi:hypothetical protein